MESCSYDLGMFASNEITCKYLPYFFGNQYRFYPMVNVIIESKLATGTRALVDSGATNTFIPYGLAETIGLLPDDKSKLRKAMTTGASGKFETLIIPLKNLQVFKENHVFETFHGLPVYVANDVKDPLPYVVLGRDSIFKRFDVSFCEDRRRIKFARRKNNQ